MASMDHGESTIHLYTVILQKFSETLKSCCNHSTIQTKRLYKKVPNASKNPESIANSEDPDQTRSSLIWVCIVCPDPLCQKLRIITIRLNEHMSPGFSTRLDTKKAVKPQMLPRCMKLQVQVYLIITLCLGSIDKDPVISETVLS